MDSFGNGIDSPWNKNALGLRGSFSAALIVHLVLLLGLSFGAAKSPSPSLMMEVTLAYTPSEDAPDNAAFIAQVNQLGDEEDSAVLEESFLIENLLEETLLEEKRTEEDIVKENPALSVQVEEYNEAPQDSRQWLARQEPRESVAALQAKLNRLQESYQSLPKISRMTSASTKSAPEAAYMRQFELRVEHVGNVNYPKEARAKRLTGKVQLLVVIIPNGRVKQVSISNSSGSVVLDQAAVRSIKLASPFQAFPDELRDRDEIHIIRTWQYQANRPLTTK